MNNADFTFEVKEHLATLCSTEAGYSLELNIVTFNGYPARLDLRKWKNGRPMKGLSLSKYEARALLEALQFYDLDKLEA